MAETSISVDDVGYLFMKKFCGRAQFDEKDVKVLKTTTVYARLLMTKSWHAQLSNWSNLQIVTIEESSNEDKVGSDDES